MASVTSPQHLPVELIEMIIKELAEPPRPMAYELPLDQRVALATCCLVNREWRALAQPVLFSRVSINSFKSLEAFARAAATGLGRYTERLSIFEIAELRPSCSPEALQLLTISIMSCREIKALLLDIHLPVRLDFSPEPSTVFDPQATILWLALIGANKLEEFVAVQDYEHTPMRNPATDTWFWSNTASFRRLCLPYVELYGDEEVAKYIPQDLLVTTEMYKLEGEGKHLDGIEHKIRLLHETGAIPYRGERGYLVRHHRADDDTSVMGPSWIRSHARAGTLWDTSEPVETSQASLHP